MPVGLVAAGVGAAGAIGGAVISSNSAKSAANTSAAASRDAQAQQAAQFQSAQTEQARQFDAAQAALRTGTANANEVQTAQHDASLGALTDASGRAIGEQNAALDQVGGLYRNSTDTIKAGYVDARAANAPYLQTGTSALTRLAQIYGLNQVDANGNPTEAALRGENPNLDPNASFYQSPDYQFRLSQGIKGTDAGAAARGMLDSGATRKAEIAYAGNLAAGEFGSYASRLAGLAGIGQTAVNTNAAGVTNYTNAITNANNGYGTAISSAANNKSNNITGTGQQIANANSGYATQYGNAQLGLGTDLANTGTSYGNNYATGATNFGNSYATSVQNAANTQANAALYQGANTSNAINGLAGTTAQYLNSNPNLFGSSYAKTVPSDGYFGGA